VEADVDREWVGEEEERIELDGCVGDFGALQVALEASWLGLGEAV